MLPLGSTSPKVKKQASHFQEKGKKNIPHQKRSRNAVHGRRCWQTSFPCACRLDKWAVVVKKDQACMESWNKLLQLSILWVICNLFKIHSGLTSCGLDGIFNKTEFLKGNIIPANKASPASLVCPKDSIWSRVLWRQNLLLFFKNDLIDVVHVFVHQPLASEWACDGETEGTHQHQEEEQEIGVYV